MSKNQTKARKKKQRGETPWNFVEERSQLMAQLFLQELNPVFLSRPTTEDVGYDFLVGFANTKAGTNTFAVRVKGTAQPPTGRFSMSKGIFCRFAHSNIPGLLLVVDAKLNHIFYAWLTEEAAHGARDIVSVPLVEITESTKKDLVAQLRKSNGTFSVAG